MTPVRLLLNAPFSGANAFFALADARGLFRQAGLAMDFTPGRGAYSAAGRLLSEDFDAAYGDLNALIEIAALHPGDDVPLAVLVAHQHSPCSITVARAGPIHGPADLAGRTLVGHGIDVALRTFGAYGRSAGLARNAVTVETAEAAMADLLQGMLAGQADGVFGYVTTHTAALAGAGLSVPDTVRFLPYREVCPALYGSALMLARRFIATQPEAARQLVQTLGRAILAAQAEPEAAIDAVLARNPQASRAIEAQRWQGTLLGDMGGSASWPQGLGDVDDQRLRAAIRCLSDASGWARTPAVSQVFSRRFLAGAPGPAPH